MESQINSEDSASATLSTVVKDPNDITTGTVGHEMDVDTPVSADHAAIENPSVDTPMSAPEEDPSVDTTMSGLDVVVEDPRVETPKSATEEEPSVDIPMSATHVVVEGSNSTFTGSITLEVDVTSSTSPPDVISTDVSTETVDPEMDVNTPTSAPDVASTEVADLEMTDAETPASNSTNLTPSISPQEHVTAESSVEASTSTISSSVYLSVPWTLIHVWEDQYTRENTLNLTNTQPLGAPDNIVAIPTSLFQEFLSFLAPRCPPVEPNVPSTTVAEEPSSNAPNTPNRARSRSAIRSARRFIPSTPLSPIIEESPDMPSKTPSLDRLINAADARRDYTSRTQMDASENDAVVEKTLPASGSSPIVVTDSMTAAASPALLRERKSERTALEIMQDVVAESACNAQVDLKCNKLIKQPTGKNVKHRAATPHSEYETPERLSQGARSATSIFDTSFRNRLARSALAQRMELRSERTQTYDADGNLVLSGGNGAGLLAGLIEEQETYDSDDDDEGMLRFAQRTPNTKQTRARMQAAESTEAPRSQSSTDNATVPETSTEAVNHDQGTAAGDTQIPQASPEIGNGQLIATTPAPTTPSRGWNIGSLLNSARSVSRFIPGFGPSTPAQPLAALPVVDNTANTDRSDSTQLALPVPENTNTSDSTQLALPVPENTNTSDSTQLALPVAENTTPLATSQVSRATQTEPRQRAPATAGPAHGARTATAPKTFRTKKDMEEQKPIIMMRGARRQKQKEDAEREEKLEKAKKAAEAKRKEEEKATVPGKKRKRPRAPTPDIIPNPPGGGYGMHPDYFCSSSSSEEDEEDDEAVDTPVRKGKQRANDSDEQPQSKRARVTDEQDEIDAAADLGERSPRGPTSYRVESEPFSHEVIGDPHRARPYTGTVFPLPTSNGSLYHGGNVFEQADSKKAARTPSHVCGPECDKEGPGRTFTVPYSDDSDEDDEDDNEEDAEDNQTASVTPKTVAKKDVDITTQKSVRKMDVDITTPRSVANNIPTPKSVASMMDVDISTPKSVANVDVDTTTAQRVEDPNAANIAYWDKLFNSPTGFTTGLEPAVTSSPQTPSRPSSSNGTLQADNGAFGTGALARARSQALKYTPKQPSGLRAQSRMSTSTVASDVGEEADEVHGGLETPAANQNSLQPNEGQQGDNNTIGPQDSSMVGNGKQGEQQGGGGTTVGEGQQQLSEGAVGGTEVEVRAAVDAVPENDLIQFDFPSMRSYAEQGIMDPEVEAYLNANWTEADTARAERSFAINFESWQAEQQFLTSSATP